jgi:hypothetical protein
MWTSSLDLTDAYFHIPILEKSENLSAVKIDEPVLTISEKFC